MQMKQCLVLALCGLANARTFRPFQEENGGRRQGQEASRRPVGQPRGGQNAQRRQGGSIRPEAGARVYQAFSNPSQVTLSQERYQGKPEAAPQRQLRPVEARRQRPGREEQQRRQDLEMQRPYREEQRPYQQKEVRRNFRPVVQQPVYEEPQVLEPIRAAPVEDNTIRRFRPQQAQQEVQRELEVPRLEEVQRVESKPAQVEEQEAPVYRPKKQETSSVYRPKKQETSVYRPKKQEAPVYRPKKQETSVYRPKKQEAPVYRPKRERVPEEDSVAAPQGVDPVFERASVQAHQDFGGPAEQRDIESAVNAGAAAYSGEVASPSRLSFQIHGQEGPHSYRYGYDTGVGYNRQFKYEERNNYGVLHGRYGYYDQAGKLQVVNYTADPEKGFHAEGEHVPKLGY